MKIIIPFSILLIIVIACQTTITSPQFNWEGLLTDEELAAPVDSLAPDENPVWAEWTFENNIPIRSLTSENFSDLRFFDDLLESKRIVQLGENIHGSSEYHQLKTRLVKYLHQELDFDVLIFESSLFECYYAYLNRNEFSAWEEMQNSIYWVWWTQECLELFEYMETSQLTAKPLTIAGCDIQMSSPAGLLNRPAFIRDVIAEIDPSFAESFFYWDTEYLHTFFNEPWYQFRNYVIENQDTLQTLCVNGQQIIESNLDLLQQQYIDEPIIPLMTMRTLWSMKHYNIFYTDETIPGISPYEKREYGLGMNLEYLLENIYPNQNIIVWGHNFHLRHKQLEAYNPSITNDPIRSMGTWTYQNHADEIYTIAFHMYTGEAQAYYNSEILSVPLVESGSLESIFYHARRKYSFLDISNLTNEPGNSWLFEDISALSIGSGPEIMTMVDQYSGIMFIYESSCPAYIPFENSIPSNYISNKRGIYE